MTGSRIAGLGTAVPERRLDNDELSASLGLDDGWIEERTGIRTRRIAAPSDRTSRLGAAAAQRALDAAGVTATDIDLIICATVTPDRRFPATACLIQSALGSHAGAFDINAGCSGFLVALSQADASIRSGNASRILIVGCEILSRITDYSDRKTAILFGDGAGAAVVEATDGPSSIGPFTLFSDGSRPQLLFVDEATNKIHMEGREVYRAAVLRMSESVARVVRVAGYSIDDIDLLVAHQANARILEGVASRLSIHPDKVFSNIARYGNTSAASIPIALAEAQTSGALKEGDLVALTAFGAGLVWGAGLMRWSAPLPTDRTLIGTGVANA